MVTWPLLSGQVAKSLRRRRNPHVSKDLRRRTPRKVTWPSGQVGQVTRPPADALPHNPTARAVAGRANGRRAGRPEGPADGGVLRGEGVSLAQSEGRSAARPIHPVKA